MTGVVGSAAVKLCAQRRGYWIDGPTGGQEELKAWAMDLSDFLELVWKVEKAASSPAEAAQWLRRLYYSEPLGKAGRGFDTFLNTDPSRSGLPMTTKDVPQSVLDLLVRVKTVRIPWEQRPENQQVDISHVLVLLDYHLNGPGTLGKVMNAGRLRNNVESMVSWAGDFGSAWLGFNKIRRANKPNEDLPFSSDAESWLNSAIAGRVSKSDLLGDLDAVVLSHQELPKSKTPISDLLAAYYQPGHSTDSEPRVADRIPLFCTRASPDIPHSIAGSGEVSLSSDAAQKIYDIFEEAGKLLLSRSENHMVQGMTLIATGRGSLGQKGDEFLSSSWSQRAMRLIADDFYNFLWKELRGVSQAWPADSPDSVPYYGYQGSIEVGPDGLPLLSDLEAMSQYFLNWKTPNHALITKEEKPNKTLVDRMLKPLRLIDPQGAEATIVSGAHPGTTRIRVERFVGFDEIVATPPNMEVHADLLYLAADTNAARPSKKYKILMVDQENSTLTILGEPVFTGISEWRVIRCPRIVLIDPWAARVGGNAAVAVPNSNRPAIKLDLSGFSENEVLSKINSNFDAIYLPSELPTLDPKDMRRAKQYLIVGVDPNNPIVYLDKQPTLPVMGGPWILPMGALDMVESLPYQLEPQDDGCDHYNGRAFIVFDGKIQSTISCTSYTSTRQQGQKRASITGNELLLFQSWLSSNDFRNFSLMIYDSVDSTGKPNDIVKRSCQ